MYFFSLIIFKNEAVSSAFSDRTIFPPPPPQKSHNFLWISELIKSFKWQNKLFYLDNKECIYNTHVKPWYDNIWHCVCMNWHEYVPKWVMFHSAVVNFNPDPVGSSMLKLSWDEWCQNLLVQSGWEDTAVDLVWANVLDIICALGASQVLRSALVPSKSTWSAPCSSSSRCRCTCPRWWHLPQ